MKKNCIKNFRALFVALLASIPMLVGCGDSAHNDQGMSFTALGWFEVPPQIENDFEIQEDGTIVITSIGTSQNISDQATSTSVALSEDIESSADTGAITGILGLQNNMAFQYVRVERAYHEYYIPGASIQPPATSVGVNVLMGSSSENEEALGFNASSSIPGSFEANPNEVYPPAVIVTPEVRSFINLNIDKMPEPPFVMIVTTVIEGVTGSGKRVRSNPIMFDVYWTPANVITPGAVD